MVDGGLRGCGDYVVRVGGGYIGEWGRVVWSISESLSYTLSEARKAAERDGGQVWLREESEEDERRHADWLRRGGGGLREVVDSGRE